MSVLIETNKLKELFEQKAAAAGLTAELEQLRGEFLGKKGYIAEQMANLRNVSADQKKEVGQKINEVKQYIEESIQKRFAEMLAAEEQRLIDKTEAYDESFPTEAETGSYHPITLVQREVEEIFRSMGFSVEDYSEVTDDYNCFEALNIPKHHPARDMQDTYYLSTGQLLKTHTSAAQNTILRKYAADLEKGLPLRAVFPSRCFRNEKIDACHENTFFQMEGMMVDKDISISNLIYFMKTMLSEVFQKDVTVRLRPGFFPFVEPGFELDIQCLICGGDGCPSCKDSGWLELCPCGMIHPNVLTAGGVDPEKYTGFAFGLGLTRLAMMRYGIKDIRVFNSCNLKSLSQFTDRTFTAEKED
ncbi:MAG: phenylalanine--tRNA ligase subunit alpha [Clostridiales bacterium]|nr:phenylalanine--tRNA ligase subunit alpha [Clostridiales bacterium]